jgi:hypothetical protein
LARITVLDVRLARDDVGKVGLPEDIRRLLLKTLSINVNPGELPFGARPTGLSVQPGALVIAGTAENVSIGQAEIGAG